MYLDVNKAHLAPLCDQDVYVELPAEAEVNEGECGKLIHWLYGCRPAAQAWEEHYSAVLKENGFKRLRSVPVAFVHDARDMVGVVHGDDFVFVGLDKDLDFVLKVLRGRYEVKNRGRLGGVQGMCERSTCWAATSRSQTEESLGRATRDTGTSWRSTSGWTTRRRC